MKMLFLALLMGVVAAQSAGCTTGPDAVCILELTIDLTGFGPDVNLAFTAPTTSIGGGSIQFLGQQNNVFRVQVPRLPTFVNVTFREGITEYMTAVYVTPNDQSTYTQTITDHRATFTLNLQGYNPANNPNTAFVNNFLPSFDGNAWGVKLFSDDGQGGQEVFREYRWEPFLGQNCAFSNVLPLSQLGDVSSMPLTVPFQLVVLPYSNIQGRVIENYSSACSALPSLYVDCHAAPADDIGVLFDPDCSNDNQCNSGLCVAPAIIDSDCNWDAIPNNPPVTRNGIQPGELVNVSIIVGPSEQPIFGSSAGYRNMPRLPWGTRYRPYILATGTYQATVRYTSDDPNPAVVNTLGTSCTDGQQCEFKAISTIAKLDLGINPARVTLTQDDRIVGTPDLPYTGENWFCTLNLPLKATAVYAGPVTVMRSSSTCRDTDQFCNLGRFYTWVVPEWDCWVNSEGLEGTSYPSAGLQFFVYTQDNTGDVRVWPPNSNDLPFYPLPLDASLAAVQVPDIPGALTLRVQEGACGPGQGANLVGCSQFDFPLTQIAGPGSNRTNTNPAGRILSAFELFYLPDDNFVTVNLLTTPAMDVFRITEDQGGKPRCYCVLPVVLQARITENEVSCYKSPEVSCVERLRPEDDDDCELCDFLSILRFDLRGLPTMSTNGVLRTSSISGFNNTFYEEDFETGSPTFGGNWQPSSPVVNNLFGTNALRVFQSTSPTVAEASFTVQVPAYTFSLQVFYDAQPFGGASVTGDVVVTGSQSGSILNAGNAPPMNLVSGQWTPNETPNLVVIPGETLTVTFRSTNPQRGPQNTPFVDNIRVVGLSYNVQDVRVLPQIGNAFNNVTVLRSCRCDTPQQYWLEITDNVQAVKELNTRCCDKDCEAFPDPFTRIMCLDLADHPMISQNQTCEAGQHPWVGGFRIYGLTDPNYTAPAGHDADWFNPTVPKDNWQSTEYDGCGYSILERLTTELWVGTGSPTTPFRVRARQGGYNGCERQAECGIYTGCPFNGGNGYKRDEYVKKNRHNLLDTYFNGNSWYTVLCLPYTVRLTEYSLFKQTDIDCSRGADCLQTEVLVAKLFVDTECEGSPDSTRPQLHSGDLMQLNIVANRSWPNQILEPNPDNQVYPGFGFDITLSTPGGEQFRGKRSKLFRPNCTFDRWVWSSATCVDCGYRQNWFMVLATDVDVTINEVPYLDRLVAYPDPRVAPSVTNGVDCTSGNCVVSQGSMFSRLWIQSFRGAPSLFANGNIPFVVLKFGNVVETPLRLIHESWVYTDETPNPFCVIADPRNEYAANWAAWASNTAGEFFLDCSSTDPNVIENCRNPANSNALGAIIVPARDQQKKTEESVVSEPVSKILKRLTQQ